MKPSIQQKTGFRQKPLSVKYVQYIANNPQINNRGIWRPQAGLQEQQSQKIVFAANNAKGAKVARLLLALATFVLSMHFNAKDAKKCKKIQ